MGSCKSVYTKGELPRHAAQSPRPCSELLLTHASTGDPPTPAGRFGSVSCGVSAPFLWVLVCAWFCLCPPSLESLFPLVLWKSCNQIPLGFKVRFPGDPQAGKPDVGFWTFTALGELLCYYRSHLCGSSTQWVRDLILPWLCLSYRLAAACSLSLDAGYPSLVAFSVSLLIAAQQSAVILLLSQEEMSTRPSTPAILNGNTINKVFF